MNLNKHSSKRFLFCVAGGYGHLHPLVPLARALKGAGHEVAFASGQSLRPTIERAGFEVFQVGGNLADDPEYREFKAQQEGLPLTLESEMLGYKKIWCGIAPRLRIPQLVEVCRARRPHMLVRETGEYAAAIAAEHLGLPHATVGVLAALKGQAIFEREAASQLDPTRQSWGLAPDPSLASLYRYLFLVFSPPGLSMQNIEWDGGGEPEPPGSTRVAVPATTHFVRPEMFDNAGGESLPAWVEQLPALPTIYATLGTEANREPGIYPDVLRTIIEGLRDLPVNLIVTLGRGKDPADFGPQPLNVHIEPYIPQSLLLPRCDLMVMHGGSGSLLAAIEAGVPVVVVPLIADQFFNAEIARGLGLGEVVQRGQLTPANIRAGVERVLEDPAYRRKVERLRAEMQALPDMQRAVELVERVAAEREPIINSSLPGTT